MGKSMHQSNPKVHQARADQRAKNSAGPSTSKGKPVQRKENTVAKQQLGIFQQRKTVLEPSDLADMKMTPGQTRIFLTSQIVDAISDGFANYRVFTYGDRFAGVKRFSTAVTEAISVDPGKPDWSGAGAATKAYIRVSYDEGGHVNRYTVELAGPLIKTKESPGPYDIVNGLNNVKPGPVESLSEHPAAADPPDLLLVYRPNTPDVAGMCRYGESARMQADDLRKLAERLEEIWERMQKEDNELETSE